MTQPTLRMLGGFMLVGKDGQEVPVPGKKAQALLAYLAMNPGQKHSREKLATLLWGDRMDEQARHSLRQALMGLRKALGAAVGGEKTDPLATDNETASFSRLCFWPGGTTKPCAITPGWPRSTARAENRGVW